MKNKGTILKIGTVKDSVPEGWHFDCRGEEIAGIEITDDAIFYAGYTLQELIEISGA